MIGNKPKVFCIGFAKTGTTSVQEVFARLGYRIGDIGESSKLIEDWAKRDFRTLIEFCKTAEAFKDIPFNLRHTYQALDSAFPGSKFVLTVRDDSDTWYRSWSTFLMKVLRTDSLPDETALRSFPLVHKGWIWRMFELTVGTEGDLFDKEKCKQVYEAHNEQVLDYFRFRPESFLSINPGDPSALDQLCGFLGASRGTMEMPHITSEMIASGIRKALHLD